MILYLDTSALVPLLIDEPTSPICGELWDHADRVTMMRLGYIEATASLAQAQRMGRLSARGHRSGRTVLETLWAEVDVIELDRGLMIEAARMADTHGLRGYDATHCAAAKAVMGAHLVAAAGDTKLLAAWRSEGLATRNVNQE